MFVERWYTKQCTKLTLNAATDHIPNDIITYGYLGDSNIFKYWLPMKAGSEQLLFVILSCVSSPKTNYRNKRTLWLYYTVYWESSAEEKFRESPPLA